MQKLKEKEAFVIRILVIILGSFISAISVNCFLVPHHLLSAGITGIALVLILLLEQYCFY